MREVDPHVPGMFPTRLRQNSRSALVGASSGYAIFGAAYSHLPGFQPMATSHARIRPSGGLYRTSVELASVDPGSFLEALRGGPRGLWSRGDRWIAWGGEVARISSPSGGGSRFERVRRSAFEILEELGGNSDRLPSEGGTAPSSPGTWYPRFFGGFSFLDGGAGEVGWAGFPSECFILPRFILEGGRGVPRLLGADGEEEVRELAGHLSSGRREPDTSLPARVPGLTEAARPGSDEFPGRWNASVEEILEEIAAGRVEKTVLARHLDLRFPGAVDPVAAMRFLHEENDRANVFLFEPEPGRPFLGAAPELLAALSGRAFEATAVAGSIARGAGAEDDALMKDRLLQSRKDRGEHQVTVKDIVEVLEPHLISMAADADPQILSLARIHHLETEIRGSTREGVDILSLVEALHPTPAVCGRPRGAALELIRKSEQFDRGWYAGPIGWFDANGDGEFVPALRSAIGCGRDWRLYAGAGIVEGSNPREEWEETALKFEPAFRALRAGTG
jgi:menaquinone-specific isochorismate synthase